MQINLIGYYGMKNIGDELMRINLIKYLRDSGKFDKINVFCRRAPQENTPGVRYYPLSRYSRFIKAFHLLKNRYTFWGGGTCIYQSQKSRGLFSLRSMQKLVKIAGNKFGFLGIGIGYLNDKEYIATAQELLRSADHCYFRDKESLDKAEEMVPDKNYCLGGDLVFLSDIKPRIINYKELKNISISAHTLYSDFSPKIYADFIEKIIKEYNCRIHFIPAHSGTEYNDNDMHKEIAKLLPSDSYTIHDWKVESEYIDILSGMDFHIGVRLHSLVIADMLGIPNIGISYSPKVRSYINKSANLSMIRNYVPGSVDIIDLVNEVFRLYQYPEDFIKQERCSALKCLNGVFESV